MRTLIASIPDTEKTPLSEMGVEYWGWMGAVVIGALVVVALTALLFRKRYRVLGVLVFLVGGAGCVAGFLRAEGLRQPQEIEDPGIPDIELPPLDDLDLDMDMDMDEGEGGEGEEG